MPDLVYTMGYVKARWYSMNLLSFIRNQHFLPLTSSAKVSTTYSPIDFVLKGKMKGEGFHGKYSNSPDIYQINQGGPAAAQEIRGKSETTRLVPSAGVFVCQRSILNRFYPIPLFLYFLFFVFSLC